MPRRRRYPQELLDRGVRLVLESGRPVAAVARDLGVHSKALRKRVRQAEIDAVSRGGVSSEEARGDPQAAPRELRAAPCERDGGGPNAGELLVHVHRVEQRLVKARLVPSPRPRAPGTACGPCPSRGGRLVPRRECATVVPQSRSDSQVLSGCPAVETPENGGRPPPLLVSGRVRIPAAVAWPQTPRAVPPSRSADNTLTGQRTEQKQ